MTMASTLHYEEECGILHWAVFSDTTISPTSGCGRQRGGLHSAMAKEAKDGICLHSPFWL